MNKYYRRLMWGLSILMTVIALGAMALMTKARAEDIRDKFQRNVNDFAYKEKKQVWAYLLLAGLLMMNIVAQKTVFGGNRML